MPKIEDNNYYDIPQTFSLKRLKIPIFIALIILLGGATHHWSKSILYIIIGAALLKNTPKYVPGKWIDYLVIAIVGVSLIQFLPIAALEMPSWRIILENKFNLSLPSTVSAQPWLSLESSIDVALAIGWLYLCSNERMSHQKRIQWLWGFSALCALLALGIIAGNLAQIKFPLSPDVHVFSYFPNRNQTSIIICMGAVTSFCLFIESLKRRVGSWILASLISSSICFFALINLLSRAGILLFFIGVFIWLVISYEKSSRILTGKYILPILLTFISILMLAGGNNLKRFESLINPSSTEQPSFRAQIYSDTIDLIKDQPILGIGYGNFEYVIPQYRNKSLIYGKTIHPENDWLWAFSELGILGFIVLSTGAIYILFKTLTPAYKHHVSYRSISSACLVIFLLHTLVDVPGHRIGTIFAAIFFFTLSTCHRKEKCPSIIPSYAFKTLAIFLICAGSLFTISNLIGCPLDIISQSELQKQAAISSIQSSKEESLTQAIQSGSKTTPLDSWWYFRQAEGDLKISSNKKSAAQHFDLAYFLNPSDVNLPLYAGLIWLPFDYSMAFSAFQDALNRPNINAQSSWSFILDVTQNYPETQNQLSRFSLANRDFRVFYLMHSTNDIFNEEILKEAKHNPRFQNINPQDLHNILLRWAQSNTSIHLLAHLQEHPEITKQDWVYKSIAYSRQNYHKQAVELAIKNIKEPTIPPFQTIESIEELKSIFKHNKNDVITGTLLLKHYLKSKDLDNAYFTLRRLKELPKHPSFILYFEATYYLYKDNYTKSWNSLHQYITSEYSI